MQLFQREINHLWLKAAVIGSLWGSIEIIVGSFFHNIKMPMAGTVLAIFGILLLSAFGQMWKDRGLFWRAGLICALMKSVSPSSVLIGPMTGIFLEALLFEFAVFIFGRNFFGYFFGGILALYSVIVHKVITLLLIYGFDLIKITENLYYFITKQLKIQDISFLNAFFLISSVYILFGMFASLAGIYIGRRTNLYDRSPEQNSDVKFEKNYDFVPPTGRTNSLYLLFMHLVAIVILLTVINFTKFYVSVPLMVAYTVFTMMNYGRSMRYIKKPGFWTQIALFVAISGIFYNGFNTSGFFTKEGMEAGIRMGMRAITIVIAFSAISTELRNPLIKAILFKRGFWQLYTALGLAFSVLPHLMEKSPRPKDLIRNPLKSVIKSLADSRFLFEMFKKYRNRTKIYAITGQIHEGKTHFAEQLISKLKQDNIITKGFLALGRFENNQRSEFFIQDIETGHSEKLCSLKGSKSNMKTERFVFHNLGLDFGTKLLDPDLISPDEIVVIDEIGPYELKGKGWSEPLEKLINKANYKMIWVVRKSLIYDIFRRFGITDGYIFDISSDTVEDVARIIEKEVV